MLHDPIEIALDNAGRRIKRPRRDQQQHKHNPADPPPHLARSLAAATLGGCASSGKSVPQNGAASLSPEQLRARNNSASLLYNLLGDEKNVSKLFIIKKGRKELQELIKSISTTAGDGAKQLEALAKGDPTLNLHATELPPGEAATRKAIAKTNEHELLHTSGPDLEFNLLLTQSKALSYGSHLAGVAEQNSTSPEQVQEFKTLGGTMDNLYKQVIALMRSPAK